MTNVSQLTNEEKAMLLRGGSFFGMRGLPEHEVPVLKMCDGGTGINFEQVFGDLFGAFAKENGFSAEELDRCSRYFFDREKLTSNEQSLAEHIEEELNTLLDGMRCSPGAYPPGILLGATWDRESVSKVGDALGLEALRYKISVLLGTPNINILREPRNGRFFEGYSEDPYLTGELGLELVKGVEGRGVASNIKHFAANNLEINRVGINEIISVRALNEIYFPAFKKLSQRAATVMASYPSINGVTSTENHWLLTDTLRKEWGFKGLVMSDWGAVTGTAGAAVHAGCDLAMPGPLPYDDVLAALSDGRLTEEELDLAASRALDLISKYKVSAPEFPSDTDFDEYRRIGDEACYDADVNGIILLQNKNDVFPVSGDETVIFWNTDGSLIDTGAGSAQVFTDRSTNLAEELSKDHRVLFNDGNEFINNPNSVAIVICSMHSSEGSDRPDLKLDPKTEGDIEKLWELREKHGRKGGRIALVLNVPGPVELTPVIDRTDGIFLMFYGGMMGGKALADLMCGRRCPSGKLPFTFPVRYEDTPAFLNYPTGFTCNYGEGVYVGYRGYEKRRVQPMFSFGFGLSYTEFKIDSLKIEKKEYRPSETCRITCSVTNIGKCGGAEVVQLYLADRVQSVSRPVKELKAFTKVYLEPGETSEAGLEFKVSETAFFDEDSGKWLIDEGYYDVCVGDSSRNIFCTESFYLTEGSPELKPGIESRITEIQKYPPLLKSLKESIFEAGLDIQMLISAIRYTPFNKVTDIYGEDAERLERFIKDCKSFRKA